jgi:hypothetical protein
LFSPPVVLVRISTSVGILPPTEDPVWIACICAAFCDAELANPEKLITPKKSLRVVLPPLLLLLNPTDADVASDVELAIVHTGKAVVMVAQLIEPLPGPVHPGKVTIVPIAFWTKAVVAICVVFVDAGVAVGAIGTPVKVGDANGANDVATNAVVATWVELVPGTAVGPIIGPVQVQLVPPTHGAVVTTKPLNAFCTNAVVAI